VPWLDKGWYLVIEFEKSTSGLFPEALRLAQAQPTYCQLMDHRGHVFHRVILRETEAEQALELLEPIQNWSHARAYVKGDPIQPVDAIRQIGCYALRQRRGTLSGCLLLPQGDWPFPAALGCRWDAVQLEWTGEPFNVWARYWFQFARLDSDHLMVIDKDRLRIRIGSAFEARGACPMVQAARFEQILGRLPDSIDLDTQPEWKRDTHYPLRTSPYAPATLRHVPPVVPTDVDAYRRYMTRILDGLQWERSRSNTLAEVAP